MRVEIQNKGIVDLTQRHYKGAGGEAAVYKRDGMAIKIYHKPSKMLNPRKIQELSLIQAPNVVIPELLVLDPKKKTPIGYCTRFIDKAEPLVKFFTPKFRKRHSICEKDIAELVKEIQITTQKVHSANCLIVDNNELNILVVIKGLKPFFIDTDSYQTPSFPATAFSPSTMDPTISIKKGNFTEESDWFSFGILAFQLYIGIHPFQGYHPKYGLANLDKRMHDGVSVFDSNVKLPKSCYDFSVIPVNHLNWFKAVFGDGERCAPPLPDVSIPLVVSKPVVVVVDTADFKIDEVFTLPRTIAYVQQVPGSFYCVDVEGNLYERDKGIGQETGEKVLFCRTTAFGPLLGILKDSNLTIKNRGKVLEEFPAADAMARNNCIYSANQGQLLEISFREIGGNLLLTKKHVGNLSILSSQMLDGFVYQDLLGHAFITVPFEEGKCATYPIKKMDGYRIIEGSSVGSVCVILAEKDGAYHRFVIDISETPPSVRVKQNVPFAQICATQTPTKVNVLSTEEGVELFIGGKVRVLSDPPFTSDNQIFQYGQSIHFVSGNKIFKARTK